MGRGWSTSSSWATYPPLLKGFQCPGSGHVLILWFRGERQDLISQCSWGTRWHAHAQRCLCKIRFVLIANLC